MYRTKSGHGSRRGARSEGLFCNHPHRICMQDRYEGHEYCIDHILEDKSAPFKQCNFVSTKTGLKCQKAAPKADRKEGYCPAHARKAAQMRHKAALKARPTDAVKDTLEDLDFYRPSSSKSVPEIPPSLATKILDYGSESESEGDPLVLEQAWRGTTDSDAESVDSEQEDALRCAGVYTAEEAALVTKDKLIRLQSLYINQFKRLQHIMREKRRSYLVALAKEREAFGIDFGVITDPKQKRKFREYQAARGFRRRRGKEALLYSKSKLRRVQATPEYQGKGKVPLMLQCCHNPGKDQEQQCTNFSLPMAKFCKDHILHDPKQVLYAECAKGEGQCRRPASLLAPDNSCSLHMGLQDHVPYKPYEPEPPPPPPQPTPRPRRPPTVIPLPEAMLPPAPVLPSLLDSQIDQLLQFQPQFLEQQLQQHVYDASQCMGSFAPPDTEVPMDTSGGQQRKAGEKGQAMATSAAGQNAAARKPIRQKPIGQKPVGQIPQIQEDSQTDIHVDVETDVEVPSDVATSAQKKESSVPKQDSETPMDVDTPEEAQASAQASPANTADGKSEILASGDDADAHSKTSIATGVFYGTPTDESGNDKTPTPTNVGEAKAESPAGIELPATSASEVTESAVATAAEVLSSMGRSEATADISDNPKQKSDETPDPQLQKATEEGSEAHVMEGSGNEGSVMASENSPPAERNSEDKCLQPPVQDPPRTEQKNPCSPVPADTSTALEVTGDHTYNQMPQEMEETGEPIIDVT